MDPAMTAANAIHNTCLVLLHERIAYPDPNLHWVQLPSLDSAEICIRAATEVSTILTKFVAQRSEPHTFAPQLGLCVFVSARSFLGKTPTSPSHSFPPADTRQSTGKDSNLRCRKRSGISCKYSTQWHSDGQLHGNQVSLDPHLCSPDLQVDFEPYMQLVVST